MCREGNSNHILSWKARLVQASLILVLMAAALSGPAGEIIKPFLGETFGQVLRLEIEFVEKPNCYYEQNIIEEPFMAKVLSVNGKKLKPPISIQYKTAVKNLKKGKIYKLNGYEDIISGKVLSRFAACSGIDKGYYKSEY